MALPKLSAVAVTMLECAESWIRVIDQLIKCSLLDWLSVCVSFEGKVSVKTKLEVW